MGKCFEPVRMLLDAGPERRHRMRTRSVGARSTATSPAGVDQGGSRHTGQGDIRAFGDYVGAVNALFL